MSGSTECIRVLHVEDSADFASLTASFLEQRDDAFAVETASDATEGLRQLADGGVDCVVSDYDMPGRDGIEFLEAVRETYPDLPFILFTGRGSEEVASEAISAGVTDYLQKDSRGDQYTVLANRVRNAVDRHRTERAERRIRNRLEAVIDANPDFVFLFDEEAAYVEIVAGADDIGAYDPEAFIGTPVDELWPSEPASVIEAAIHETFQTGDSRRIEYRLPVDGEAADDDAQTWYEGRTALVDFSHQDRPRVLLTARDVTRRKARERELRAFERAVENAGHQIYWTDTDGTIEYVNPAFEDRTGYDAAEAVGRTPRILKSGVHDDAFYEELWETILSGDTWRSALVNRTKSGERYVVDQTIAPVEDASGDVECFVAVNADVAEADASPPVAERDSND